MIDNFELIKNFWLDNKYNGDEDYFLFGQIMVRKKDGSKFARSNNRIIKDLVFRNPTDFGTKKDEIVAICDTLGARAYININPRSFKGITVSMAGICLDYIRTGGEGACRSIFSTACGRDKPKGGYWIVDIDEKCPTIEQEASETLGENHVCTIPTVNGLHLITKPHDIRDFRNAFNFDIHKNNPTLLYYP